MKSNDIIDKYGLYIIGVVALLTLFNWYQISAINFGGPVTAGFAINKVSQTFSSLGKSGSSGISTVKTSNGELALQVKRTGDDVQDVINSLIPTGTPEWGPQLGVSYDDPVNSLNVLANLDYAIPTKSLTLEEKQRFVDVGTKISCEFCCSAPAVIDHNGRDLCGCSHAASFRGLAKYFIKSYPDKYTNEEILLELTKWKSLYYPRNMVEKGVALLSNNMELTASGLNDRQLLSKLSSGDLSNIGQLPSMVGGC